MRHGQPLLKAAVCFREEPHNVKGSTAMLLGSSGKGVAFPHTRSVLCPSNNYVHSMRAESATDSQTDARVDESVNGFLLKV